MNDRKKKIYEKTKKMFADAGCPTIEKEWLPARSKWRFICLCGKIKRITPSSFKKGSRCKDCRSKYNRKSMYEETVKMFAEKGMEAMEVEWRPANVAWKFRCSCGVISKRRPAEIRQGAKCRECGHKEVSKKLRASYDEIRKTFENIDEVLVEITFEGGDTYVEFKCNKGHTVKITYVRFRMGVRCQTCHHKSFRGEGNPRWNPELSDEERMGGRNNPEYVKWTQDVFKRDEYTCKKCRESKSGELNAHHILSYKDHKDLRTCINNGITLCKQCHVEFHKRYGFVGFGKEDLVEYLM